MMIPINGLGIFELNGMWLELFFNCPKDSLKFGAPMMECMATPNPLTCITAFAEAADALENCCGKIMEGNNLIDYNLKRACITFGFYD